jgi:hypothetical protein
MSAKKPTFSLVVIAAYLLAMAWCIHQAFDFSNSDVKWFFAVLALTLPWSSLLALFIIFTHGTGLKWTWMYWSFAILNSAIFYWLCYRQRRMSD